MFTQGPWILTRGGCVLGGPLVEYVNGKAMAQVAMACLHETITDEQRDANARLIAAAPTMAAYIQKRAEAGDAEAQAIWETAVG